LSADDLPKNLIRLHRAHTSQYFG